MVKKLFSFLYTFDLIGIEPQLLIFKESRYKTLFSSILSILIILFSIIFSIVSLIEYFKFESPIIVYSKDNDIETKREIFINNTILMFQLIESAYSNVIDDSIAYYEAEYELMYDNGTYSRTPLKLEKCEMGKHIDSKYQSHFEEKYSFGRTIEDFYCINQNNNNITIFYYPLIGYSNLNFYIIFKNNSKYTPDKIQSLIVTENDLIEHKRKKDPITENFYHHYTAIYNTNEYSKINYNFQFIKYESDEGLFYKNSKILKGISFSDMSFITKVQENFEEFIKSNKIKIGQITLSINRANFDNYQRTYPRLQSLLADVMSVINLLFNIGRMITNILCEKKMSKDIVGNVLKKIKYFTKIEKQSEIKTNIDSDKSFKMKTKVEEIYKTNNVEEENKIEKIFKKINYYHIFKSFFCFKDRKTKFINFCNEIITEDICIERILERFNNLENICKLISKKHINNFKLKNRYNEAFQYISNNDNEMKLESFSKDNNNK